MRELSSVDAGWLRLCLRITKNPLRLKGRHPVAKNRASAHKMGVYRARISRGLCMFCDNPLGVLTIGDEAARSKSRCDHHLEILRKRVP